MACIWCMDIMRTFWSCLLIQLLIKSYFWPVAKHLESASNTIIESVSFLNSVMTQSTIELSWNTIIVLLIMCNLEGSSFLRSVLSVQDINLGSGLMSFSLTFNMRWRLFLLDLLLPVSVLISPLLLPKTKFWLVLLVILQMDTKCCFSWCNLLDILF